MGGERSMSISKFLAIFVSGFLPQLAVAQASQPTRILHCKKPNNQIFFFNGIQTTFDEALAARGDLETVLLEDVLTDISIKNNPLTLLYNYSDREEGPSNNIIDAIGNSLNGAADLVAEGDETKELISFLKRIRDNAELKKYTSCARRRRDGTCANWSIDVDRFLVNGVVVATQAELRGAWLADEIDRYNRNFAFSKGCHATTQDKTQEFSERCLSDPRIQAAIIDQSVNSRDHITIIGYSQGSIFAEIYKSAQRGLSIAQPENILVGTPLASDLVSQGSTVINNLATDPVAQMGDDLGGAALTLGQNGLSGHSFTDTYLAEPYREKISAAVASLSVDRGDAIAKCFGPNPEIENCDHGLHFTAIDRRGAIRLNISGTSLSSVVSAKSPNASVYSVNLERASSAESHLSCSNILKWPRQYFGHTSEAPNEYLESEYLVEVSSRGSFFPYFVINSSQNSYWSSLYCPSEQGFNRDIRMKLYLRESADFVSVYFDERQLDLANCSSSTPTQRKRSAYRH